MTTLTQSVAPDLASRHLFEDSGDLVAVPEPDPEVARQTALRGSPEEKARFVEDLAINVQGLTDPLALIGSLMARSRVVRRPGGLLVLGPGGSGKSFIASRLLRRYPPRESPTRRVVPVAFAKLGRNQLPGDVLKSLLKGMGQRLPKAQYKESELQFLLIQALDACVTRVILLDEAHHMTLTTGKRNADRAAGPLGELFKEVYDESGVALAFLGKPSLGELFENDDQSDTRWAAKVDLTNFLDSPLYRGVLNTFDKAMPMERLSGLGEDPFYSKIVVSCKGNFRRTKDFLRNAVMASATQGASSIDECHLSRAHYETFGPEGNPFRCK